VPESEAHHAHPFQHMFDLADALGRARPEYRGLARQDALAAAHQRGLATRVLDLPANQVAWRSDMRSDRLNLVVEAGRVVRAAVF
jgi:hypothetical protein